MCPWQVWVEIWVEISTSCQRRLSERSTAQPVNACATSATSNMRICLPSHIFELVCAFVTSLKRGRKSRSCQCVKRRCISMFRDECVAVPSMTEGTRRARGGHAGFILLELFTSSPVYHPVQHLNFVFSCWITLIGRPSVEGTLRFVNSEQVTVLYD